MNESLQRIQTRLEAFEQATADIVAEFHDEQTMSYFSDRFGPDHPLSERADAGVRLQQMIFRIREHLSKFADEFEREFQLPQ